MTMRWQYKRVNVTHSDVTSDTFEEQLNLLGGEHWELVATVPHEQHGYSHDVDLVFKRPVGP